MQEIYNILKLSHKEETHIFQLHIPFPFDAFFSHINPFSPIYVPISVYHISNP